MMCDGPNGLRKQEGKGDHGNIELSKNPIAKCAEGGYYNMTDESGTDHKSCIKPGEI